MTDAEKREKVIRSLETAVKNFERYSGDEYGREYDYARVEVETLEDALALLKAQEPVIPSIGGDADAAGNSWWYTCGACHEQIDKGNKFCRWCGEAVKWE